MSGFGSNTPPPAGDPRRAWWRSLLRDLPRRYARRWKQRLRHGRAASIPHVSQIVRADVDRANAALERIFLNLGRHFEPLTERMQGLVRSSESLRELASGREHGQTLFQRAITVLHEPLEFIDRCVSQHTRLLELLKRCEEEMRVMLRFQMQMSDLLAPLSFVEVLFRVESASLEMEQRETFGTVAADIHRLRQLVGEAFEKNSGLLGSTHATLAAVRQRLENDFRHHARAISEKRQSIEAALSRLDQQLLSNARQDTDARALARQLSVQVATVVSALQFQDIIKQKCSHVVEALADWEEHHLYDRAFVRVQVAHLRTVDQDIDQAVSEISGGIGRIRELGEGIERRSLSMDDLEGMIASADGMVQMLLDSIRETRGILTGTTALIREANEAARPAGNIAANLTSTLGELSINMRLVALNAQVRSVQITDVTGLEVLAVRTAEISNRITGVSHEVAERLGRLRDVTDEMFGLFDRFSQEGSEREQRMELAQGPVETELHQLRDRTLAVFQTITQAVEHVRAAASGLDEALADVPQAHAGLIRAVEDLEGFAENYCSESDELSARAEQLLAAHAGKYTMASERHVHVAATGGGDAMPEVEQAAPELFDTADVPAEVSPQRQMAGGPAARSRQAAGTPAETSLGTNVDLF
ncbi:MAG: hypothetical protein IAE82_05395 [Opitutaceae bacterium]|nr:hypothetical protein [Opitutaceae bacterium]